jgi:transcription antitermination factor NusG
MLERGEVVKIKAGVWKGEQATIVQVINSGERYGVKVTTRSGEEIVFSLAASSVERV